MGAMVAEVSRAQAPDGGGGAAGPKLIEKGGYRYRRRRPEQTALYQVVQDNLETLYAAVEEGFVSASLPDFVRNEFERFLDCGLLCKGAALLVCESEGCSGTQVVALSCKGRGGFCGSCAGRRMVQTAANVVERVLPPDVPLRQFVVTFPYELRGRLGFDSKLLSAVSGVVVDTILAFYERRMRDVIGPLARIPLAEPSHQQGTEEGDAAASSVTRTRRAKTRRRKLQSGTVTAVQRVNSDFRLNPHLHVVALDGVFVEQLDGGPPKFRQLPHLKSIEVAELVTTIRIRVLALLVRRGVIEDTTEQLVLLPDDLAESEPVLAQLTEAAATGLPPAGPERREREPLRLARTPGATISGALCAQDMGFTIHAATIAPRDDSRPKEALLRYILRPPLAQERVSFSADGAVRLGLKRAFSDGTVAVELDPLSFLCRLAASVPGPGFHTFRYGGILSAAAQYRPLVVPEPSEAASKAAARSETPASGEAPSKPRSTWRPWSELLKRSFDIDIQCAQCGGPMRLKAFLTRPQSLRRLLQTLGEPSDAPQRAPPRPPPYFAGKPRRYRQHDSGAQTALFDEPA
jgi:hypothetical protein